MKNDNEYHFRNEMIWFWRFNAPFIVAVSMQHVVKERLRETLFVLWFIIVVRESSPLKCDAL